MMSGNSRTSEYHVLTLKLTNKLDLRRGQKSIALSNRSIYYTWKNIKSSSDIQDYFEYILKKHNENIDNPSIKIYVNKIEKRITFKIKNGYYLELLTTETMKLLGSAESKTNKDKNGENVLRLEITELVLVHCNLVNSDYQQDSRILYTFVPNKPFGSLLEIIFFKKFRIYLIGENFVGEIFRWGKFSSLVKNFVTFPRRKFSPRVKNRVYRVYLFAIRVRYNYWYFS